MFNFVMSLATYMLSFFFWPWLLHCLCSRKLEMFQVNFFSFFYSLPPLCPLCILSLLSALLDSTQSIPSFSCLYYVIKGYCAVPWTACEAVGCVERQLLSAEGQTPWGFVLLSWKAWNKSLEFLSASSDIDLFTFWKWTWCLAFHAWQMDVSWCFVDKGLLMLLCFKPKFFWNVRVTWVTK